MFNTYAIKQLLIYAVLLFIGCSFLLIAFSGAFGKVFAALAFIAGASFTGVSVYGLVQRKTFGQLPRPAKVITSIGALATVAFVALMTLIVMALRNFS